MQKQMGQEVLVIGYIRNDSCEMVILGFREEEGLGGQIGFFWERYLYERMEELVYKEQRYVCVGLNQKCFVLVFYLNLWFLVYGISWREIFRKWIFDKGSLLFWRNVDFQDFFQVLLCLWLKMLFFCCYVFILCYCYFGFFF